ncbi:hypothetical protein NQZ79_g1861 [Umbelopsis isabellina]|nr:hypothetical protein NQZ79_g1861 [Umbelopsis isabellina]
MKNLGHIEPSEYYDQENGGTIPVFRPTMAEFEDFLSYIQAIDAYGRHAGIVKIVPPKEWSSAMPDVNNLLETVRVRNPIVQHIIGSQGIYTQTNVEKRRPYTVQQWYNLCQSDEHRPPTVKVDRPQSLPATKKRRVHTSEQDNIAENQQKETSAPPSASTRSKSRYGSYGATSKFPRNTISLPQDTHLRSPPPSPPRKPAVMLLTDKSVKTKRELKAEELELAHSEKHDPLSFNYHCEDDDKYTVEYCKELERTYWRNLTFTQPMYGADMQGTLFDDSTKSWNVNHLDNILNRIGVELPGVNTAYLYFGQWKATFAWHVEDMDLYSINYLHFGAPKQWYAIQSDYRKRFETVMQNIFSPAYKTCSEFLRHKTFIASPTVLANNSIPVSRLVQHEGEFVVTFPYGYHSGYNLGFNCAESTNFALDSWVDIGRTAKACTCIKDSVKIDVSIFEPHVIQGPTTPPEEEMEPPMKKRKAKRSAVHGVKSNPNKCLLCPLLGADLATEDGRRAHRLCADFVPETRVVSGPKGDVVLGIDDVPNARWKLKCVLCGKVDGACIQCRKGRCCRAFHTTCAQNAGITLHVERLEDGNILQEGYCPMHDPKREMEKLAKRAQYVQDMVAKLTPNTHIWARWKGGPYFAGTIQSCASNKQNCRVSFADGYSLAVPWKDILLESPESRISTT